MEGFREFQYTLIPSSENFEADALAVLASTFQFPENPKHHFQIEVRHKPLIPYNVEHCKVFEDDEQINRFLQMSGEFKNIKIDQENMYDKGESVEPKPTYLTQLAGKDIIQLKSNSFPRGMVPLEEIFDSNDVAKSPKVAPRDGEVEERNIGTEKDPKFIKNLKI
jgi:hypothetical protein